MSLPINMKFEVPKHKAPPPSKVPLWPPLTPPPGKAKASDEKGEGRRAGRPISSEYLASLKATDGLPGRRGQPGRRTRHGRSTIVKLALTAIPMIALTAVVGVGCAKEKPAAQAQASVLDVKRPAAAAAPTYGGPAYQPPPPPAYQPPAQGVRSEPVAPAGESAGSAAAAKPAAAGNRTYVVQKGDTLFGIAKSQYGDGNKYKKIAAANPTVNAGALKAGQKIVIPQ